MKQSHIYICTYIVVLFIKNNWSTQKTENMKKEEEKEKVIQEIKTKKNVKKKKVKGKLDLKRE